jgi:ParB-like chromosome segregation protein Spo0J
VKVKTADLVIDEAIQIRDALDPEMVDRYVECFDALPPIDVFSVAAGYLVADGFHRQAAAVKLKRAEMEATLHKGGWEDAEAFAITANTKHGKPLTRPERNRAIQRLLDLGWTLTKISEATGVALGTAFNIESARKLRATLPVEIAEELHDTHLYRIATVEPEQRQELAARAVADGWTEPETRAAAKTLRNPDVAPTVKAAILDGTLPPITSAGGQVVILEDTVQRVTEDALRKDAQLAVVAFNSAAAQLRSFTVDEIAAALDTKIRTATVAQFGLTMAALDALIVRLTAKVVS